MPCACSESVYLVYGGRIGKIDDDDVSTCGPYNKEGIHGVHGIASFGEIERCDRIWVP